MLSRRQKIKKGNDKEKHKLTMQGCEIVLRKIAHHRLSDPFLVPVDLELYSDYQTMVRKPMDFSTVWKKVKGKGFTGFTEFTGFTGFMGRVFGTRTAVLTTGASLLLLCRVQA